MMMELTSPVFWTALGSIVLANILLSGDNAVVIALAARGLPARQQRQAIIFGSVCAILMRIALTLIAVKLLGLPYLKIVGGLLLLYIGVGLLADEEKDHSAAAEPMGMAGAIRTILVADVVMSLDNVLAVAAAAQGSTLLLTVGLAISIPLIIFGSTLLLSVMQRFPVIIVVGAALLGWLAGEMILTDPAVEAWFGPTPHAAELGAAALGAALVVAIGHWRRKLRRRSHSTAPRA